MMIDKMLNFLSSANFTTVAEIIIDLLEAIIIVIPLSLCAIASLVIPILQICMFMFAAFIDTITTIFEYVKKIISFLKKALSL